MSSNEKMKFELVLSATGQSFTSSVGKAIKGVSSFQDELGKAKKAADRLDRGLSGMAGKFTAVFGGISGVAFGKSIFDAGVAMDNLNKSFTSVTGSSGSATAELEFIKETAEELGLEFSSTAESYKRLVAAAMGTELEGDPTRAFLRSVAEAATATGASADEINRAFIQVAQGISRGKFELEDLKTIAEALPGVGFNDFAKSIGVTTEELFKMIRAGQVVASDFIPGLTKVLHDKFGAAAQDAADSAQAAVNRFKNAWFELKVAVGESGFMDIATGRLKDLTTAMADPEMQKRIVELTTNFFDMADAVLQFTIEHGEMIVKVTAGAVALSAISRTVHLLTGIWGGLNAAMLVMTGSRLIPYLSGLSASLNMTKIAAMGAAGALGAAAGSTLAFIGGLQGGFQLYKMTEPAERALRDLSHEIDMVAAKYRQFAGFQPESKESLFKKSADDLQVYEKKLVGAFRHQSALVNSLYARSKDTNIFGQMTEGARTAEVELVAAKIKLNEIETAMDEYGQVADVTYNKVAESARAGAETEVRISADKLKKMEAQYKQYVDQIKRLQDEMARREQSLAERLRAASRSTMTEGGKWQDMKKQAQEYEVAADKAFAAGNNTKALELIDKSLNMYESLNREVKENETVVIAQTQAQQVSMESMERVGTKGIKILQAQTTAAEKARDALDKESGGQLSKSIGEADKNVKKMNESVTKLGKNFRDEVDSMEKKLAQSIQEMDTKLQIFANKKRVINLQVKEVAAKAEGGMIQKFRAGGKLAGYGGGDRVPALLEAGEFVVRKEAVKKYGASYLLALNSMRLNDLDVIRARIGGLIPKAEAAGRARYKDGGVVHPQAQAQTQGDTIHVTLNYSGQANRQDASKMTDMVVQELKRRQRGRAH